MEKWANGFDIEAEGCNVDDTAVQQCLAFFAARKGLKPYRTEWRIFDEDIDLAGSIDLLCVDEGDADKSTTTKSKKPPASPRFVMVDYKRTKALETKGRGKGVGPCAALSDTNTNHYYVQQNLYRHILERKYGIIVDEMVMRVPAE